MGKFKGDDIADRLIDLAAAVLKLVPRIHRHTTGRNIAKQLERCATSGGANYEEARGAESVKQAILQREKESPSQERSNHGGWQSSSDLLTWSVALRASSDASRTTAMESETSRVPVAASATF